MDDLQLANRLSTKFQYSQNPSSANSWSAGHIYRHCLVRHCKYMKSISGVQFAWMIHGWQIVCRLNFSAAEINPLQILGLPGTSADITSSTTAKYIKRISGVQ
jgi:hypothetical protein